MRSKSAQMQKISGRDHWLTESTVRAEPALLRASVLLQYAASQ